jgi:hypothetical protein
MIRAGELAKATDLPPQFLAIFRANQVINRYPALPGSGWRPRTATIPAMTKFFPE